LMDEKVNFFYFHRETTLAHLGSYHSQHTGIRDEHEYIQTKVLPLNKAIMELPNVSAGTLLGTFLVSVALEINL